MIVINILYIFTIFFFILFFLYSKNILKTTDNEFLKKYDEDKLNKIKSGELNRLLIQGQIDIKNSENELNELESKLMEINSNDLTNKNKKILEDKINETKVIASENSVIQEKIDKIKLEISKYIITTPNMSRFSIQTEKKSLEYLYNGVTDPLNLLTVGN